MDNKDVSELMKTQLISYLDKTVFTNMGTAHEWRNYIPDRVIKIWKELTHKERLLVYLIASEASDREEWD